MTAKLDDYSQFKGWSGDYTSDDLTIQVTDVQQAMTVTYDTVPDIDGCSTDVAAGYSGGFEAADFNMINVDVESGTKHMVLNTGNQAIDPNSIVVPFTQDVYVTFVYEDAGFKQTDFGWVYASEGKDGVKHPIYSNINDDDKNGILDGQTDINGDHVVNLDDNKRYLGKFEGGTELVFYLDSRDNGCGSWCGGLFFTKKEWNEQHHRCLSESGISRLVEKYTPNTNSSTSCAFPYVANCGVGSRVQGWLDAGARARLLDDFGFDFSPPGTGDPPDKNTVCIDELNDETATHAIVAAPDNSPFAWVVAFDDTIMSDSGNLNDYDYNDLVFLIERKTGGTAKLELSKAIVPNEANAYFTGVVLDVYDYNPGGACQDKTRMVYYVSADGGSPGSWIEITAWDKANEYTLEADGSKTLGAEIDPVSLVPGNPEYVYRSRRVDLAGLGLTGNKLIWKVEMISEDEECVPKVIDVQLTADTASHGSFARSSPVVQTNVLYAGTYETPEATWNERINRGHLTASRLYDPEDPSSTLTGDQTLWDAGAALTAMGPDSRTIYFPDITTVQVTDEVLATGDGSIKTFSGTLTYHPVVASTVVIKDDQETFNDQFTDDLRGNFTGTGKINRFTGEWTVTFKDPPLVNVPIKASYSYYTASSSMLAFNDTNVTKEMLALTDEYVNPTGYTYDFNGSNTFEEDDADWLVQWVRGYRQPPSTKKEWLLGPIDHSTPALLVPPGYPLWYFGSQVTKAERNKYKEF